MTTRTLGGSVLLADALLALALMIVMSTSVGGQTFFMVAAAALSLLFIICLVVIWSLLPHTGRLGQVGQIGLWCLGIASAIALAVDVISLVSTIDVGVVVPFSSALFALIGSLLVGWVTIRAQGLSSVIGWLLIAGGVLNLIGGLLPPGVGTTLVGISATLAQAGAVGGFGWTMLRGGRAAIAPTARIS